MSHGLIQPVVLRAAGRGYELVAGERKMEGGQKGRPEGNSLYSKRAF